MKTKKATPLSLLLLAGLVSCVDDVYLGKLDQGRPGDAGAGGQSGGGTGQQGLPAGGAMAVAAGGNLVGGRNGEGVGGTEGQEQQGGAGPAVGGATIGLGGRGANSDQGHGGGA